MSEAAAIVELTTIGLRIDEVVEVADASVPAGQAVGTDPPAGSRLIEGAELILVVSVGQASPSP